MTVTRPPHPHDRSAETKLKPPDPSAPTGQAARHRGSWLSRITQNVEFQLLIGLAVLVGMFMMLYPDTFGTGQNVTNMATVGGILLVVAIGQTFALLVGGFDLSVAANMGFTSIVVALQLTSGAGTLQATAVGVGAGALVGLVNGILVAVLRITPFVTTLGMLTFLGGYTNVLSGGRSIAGLPESFRGFGGGDWGPLPSAVGLAAVVMLVAWVILARTRVGLYIYAIGGSRETARVSGLAVARYQVVAFTLCGLFAGTGGVMLASRVSAGQDTLGQGYDLLSIATAVIGGVAIGGGVGRLRGVLLGVMMLTVLTTGLDIAGIGEFVKQMITGGVLVLAVLVVQLRGYRLSSLVTMPAWSRRRPGATQQAKT